LTWNIAGERERASLGQPPYGDRAIVQKLNGQMVGVCGLVPSFGPFRRLLDGIENCKTNSPEVGLFYAIASEHRRQGYATEASRALIQFAFESLQLHRIVATTEANNTASIEVMRRLNFTSRHNTQPGFPEVVGFLRNPCEKPSSQAIGSVWPLECRPATLLDVPLLAAMNQQLIQDEGSRNPMTLAELEERMREWLASNWQAVVVEIDSEAVGYLLFQFRSDEYLPSDTTVYVRQFFIGRNCRSRGIGRQAFNLIRERFFPRVSSVVLDVLEVNSQARRFWMSLGFKPYCTTMKLNLL
jgi:RimJ/RimL family protein N-acetyltransferase